jgi:hypothetical protein
MTTNVDQVFADYSALAQQLATDATTAIQTAGAALSTTGFYEYAPFEFQSPVMSFGGANITFDRPGKPTTPNLRTVPTVDRVPTGLEEFNKALLGSVPLAPTVSAPSKPGESLPSVPTSPTVMQSLNLPSVPNLLPMGSTTLPYATVAIPTPPAWSSPQFTGVAPGDVQSISMNEYLALLTASYDKYASSIPNLVRSNWRTWYQTLLADHPQLTKLQNVLSSYLDTGGSGVPAVLEDAIVTRAKTRVVGEQRRATSKVWDEMAKRGLWMPSGALAAGLKEAAQLEAESTSKVITDVALKNLDLEHDHMKFMVNAGRELETSLCNVSIDTAKVCAELNGQAIEITKLVLTGMIEINKAIIQIYIAKWEGYKAAVEVYKAEIQAIESRVRVYEAEIRAELAKTEVDKAYVQVLTAITNANSTIASMYKTQIEAETAKLEIDKVHAQLYEAQIRAYVGQVDAYRARWDGYGSEVRANLATAQVYESQVRGYTAGVDAYRAEAGAYEAKVRGFAAMTDAIARSNEANLRAWTAEIEGLLKVFGTEMEAYKAEWQATIEKVRVQSVYWQSNVESLRAYNSTETQIQMEQGREHLTQWVQQLEAALRAAQSLSQLSSVSGSLAQSALSGITGFAGTLATTQS